MKKKKIPGIFRKTYTEKKFKGKILKRLHLPSDRKLVDSLFEKDPGGRFVLKSGIPDDAFPRLKPLAKTIRKNRGMVSRWKAGIILVLAAAVLVFNFFFRDSLIKQAAEQALESVFKADAEIENPKLSLIRGVLSFGSLTIADADDPFRNLIETGPAELKIDTAELTFRRLRIERLSLEDVQWNTPREADGTLPVSPPETSGKSESRLQGAMDVLALSRDDFDFQALLEEERGNLKSEAFIREANQEFQAFNEKWRGIFQEKKAEIGEIASEASAFKSVSLQDLGAVEQMRSLYSRTDQLKSEISGLRGEFLAEKAEFQSLKASAGSVIDEDTDYLAGKLDFSPAGLKTLASSAGERYIRNRWDDLYTKGLKVLNIIENFRSRKEEKDRGKRQPRRSGGRDIVFPGEPKPSFLMETVFLSGGTEDSGTLETELRWITDEPDKIENPLTFRAGLAGRSLQTELDGYIDLRTDARTSFLMNISSPGNRLDLENGIPALGIESIRGLAEVRGQSAAQKGSGGVETVLNIMLSGLELSQPDPEEALSRAVADLFSGVETARLTAEIQTGRQGLKDIRVSSDLDSLISERVGGLLEAEAERLKEELRSGLEDYLAGLLEENETLQSAAAALGVESLDQLDSLDDLQKILDTGKSRLETRSAEVQTAVQQEADKAAAQAQAEADRLEAEARQKAEEEAANVLGDAAKKIKIPGF